MPVIHLVSQHLEHHRASLIFLPLMSYYNLSYWSARLKHRGHVIPSMSDGTGKEKNQQVNLRQKKGDNRSKKRPKVGGKRGKHFFSSGPF